MDDRRAESARLLEEVRVSDSVRVGQVWRWHVPERWDECWLLLTPHGKEHYDGTFSALQLETGVVDYITPCLTAGDWELLG